MKILRTVILALHPRKQTNTRYENYCVVNLLLSIQDDCIVQGRLGGYTLQETQLRLQNINFPSFGGLFYKLYALKNGSNFVR